MSDQPTEGYQEMVLSTFRYPIADFEAFIERAKKAGHKSIDVEVDLCPYYGGVDNVRLVSTALENPGE
jgi:hypothetical protein